LPDPFKLANVLGWPALNACCTGSNSNPNCNPAARPPRKGYLPSVEIPEAAPPHMLAAWHALADQVAGALSSAGLPVIGPTDAAASALGRECGAVVEVDRFADAGGVFVHWRTPRELAGPAHEALLARRLDDPAIQRHGLTVSIMAEALKRLLAQSSFTVEDAAIVNDLRVLQIYVRSRKLEPLTSSLSGLMRVLVHVRQAGLRRRVVARE
jgi:hypothetical protein